MRTSDDTRAEVGPGALTDPDWVVPPVPQDVPEGGMAWLRARVARFSSGEAHVRRRALAVGPLGGGDAADALRDAARVRTEALLEGAGEGPGSGPGTVDVMARVARVVPVEVLADFVGLPVTAETAGLVGHVARAYHAHGETVPAADRALARLVAVCGGTWDEATAARIGLLVQAYDATAGLIGSAAHRMLSGDTGGTGDTGSTSGTGDTPEGSAESAADVVTASLDRTLSADPPVRGTLRAPADGGDPVRIALLTDDGSLAFGAGPHACPGRAHARALAAGVLDALLVRGCRLVRPDLAYEPSPNLRVPVRLEVTCT
ncbi:hypothetical protein [Streptomyces rimosus]|uniref:hypothetical protein n=1 Tax=Streptomyces rimosus TaxID=1927 RepID=UPI0037D9071F